MFGCFPESGAPRAAVCRRQPCLLPVPDPGRAAVHDPPDRHHRVRLRLQPTAIIQGGMSNSHHISIIKFVHFNFE